MKNLPKLSQTVLFLASAAFGSMIAVIACMKIENNWLCLAIGLIAWIVFYLAIRVGFGGMD
jgi:FtsH-binding integral membrane protein